MNALEGKMMSDIFFKYYYERRIESMDDIQMLDKLVSAGHTEYVFNNGKAYAKATSTGRMLHSVVPQGY
ncbi:MAG: hypothetical protein FWH47_01955 [Methanomassiliicoccaceae archaeon]|nr:hypothetical protein [Methanomassiliicoccaceae archaeon]